MTEQIIEYIDPHAMQVSGVDANAPVAPFLASVEGARRLVPTIALDNSEAPPRGVDKALTRLQVLTWVQELTVQVEFRLARWRELATIPGSASLEMVAGVARNVIHNGVASYMVTATGRGGTGYATTDYGQVLWERYEKGLLDLATYIDGRLPADEAMLPAWSFPSSTIGDVAPWHSGRLGTSWDDDQWEDEFSPPPIITPEPTLAPFGEAVFGESPFGGTSGTPNTDPSVTGLGTARVGLKAFGGNGNA